MNKLDLQYQNLLKDILENGTKKQDRTGTGTISVFGRQLRHDFRDGFPLLTTKRMAFKQIVTELIWFLRGDTNIKYLVDNDCHIWDGDTYKNYLFNSDWHPISSVNGGFIGTKTDSDEIMTQELFINKIKTDDEFAKKWGSLGPVYGKQWRSWNGNGSPLTKDYEGNVSSYLVKQIDQITNLINDLKTNPDSRRLMVNAWNVGELDQMVLPPCHYGFQVYTRELSLSERTEYKKKRDGISRTFAPYTHQMLDNSNIPTRAISLMWNQRSVDTFLGLPFNIASYGLLLEIIAKAVNMVPDELIGNLGDVHLYSNHIEQAKEQIGREFTQEEIQEHLQESGMDALMYEARMKYISKLPKRTREPYPLPTLNINTEFWPYEGGECGMGSLDAIKVFESFKNEIFCKCLLEEDIQLSNYQSHPSIKAPLSN
jgi:thymidylate synthase